MLVAIPNVYANFCQLLQKKLVLAFFFRISSPHYNLRTSVVLLPDERPNESCRKFVSLAFFFFFSPEGQNFKKHRDCQFRRAISIMVPTKEER